MILYRTTFKKWAGIIEPSGICGRWDQSGRNIMYCSSSPALSFLEFLINHDSIDDYPLFITEICIPARFTISTIKDNYILDNWHSNESINYTREFGEKWSAKKNNYILKVPSMILHFEFNYLFNTSIKDLINSTKVTCKEIHLDKRLLKKWNKF